MRPKIVSAALALVLVAGWAEAPMHLFHAKAGPLGEARGGSAGRSVTFDQFGAIGDGRQADQRAMQTAVDAGAGRMVQGVAGKTYTLRGQVYVPSNTTIDCRGATIQFDPMLGSAYVNAMFWVGYSDGRGASNVEIRNCNFQSALGGNGYSAIMFQPGSSHIKIHSNNSRNTAGYGLRAIVLRTARLSDIQVYENTAADIQNLVNLDGNESHTHHHCVAVPSGKKCANAADPPPPNTIAYRVPPELQSDIAAGDAYGIIVYHPVDSNNTFRLYGPYDHGTDFTYAEGTITFRKPLPVDRDVEVQLFTWTPAVAPANDARDLAVRDNIGARFRGAAVQINCPVRAQHKRTPLRDCVQNVAVTGNRFDGGYQPQRTLSDWQQTGRSPVNLLVWSQDFANAAWRRSGLAAPETGVVSPPYDKTTTAQLLKEDNAVGHHQIVQNVAVTPGARYTLSCFVKAAGRTKARLYLLTSTGPGVYADFDLEAGTNTGKGTAAADHRIDAGILPQGDGWHRAWVSGVLGSAVAQPTLYIENAAGQISYAGDGKSGITVWGCQLERRNLPRGYIATQASPASYITGQLISVNGVNRFTVANNVLGPSFDQCIHLEDHAGNGTVTDNSCRDAAGIGIYLTDTHSVIVKNNSIINSHNGCIMLDYANPAPVALDEPFMQNVDITLINNLCDGRSNPAIAWGYRIGKTERLKLAGNRSINLPPNAPAYFYPEEPSELQRRSKPLPE